MRAPCGSCAGRAARKVRLEDGGREGVGARSSGSASGHALAVGGVGDHGRRRLHAPAAPGRRWPCGTAVRRPLSHLQKITYDTIRYCIVRFRTILHGAAPACVRTRHAQRRDRAHPVSGPHRTSTGHSSLPPMTIGNRWTRPRNPPEPREPERLALLGHRPIASLDDPLPPRGRSAADDRAAIGEASRRSSHRCPSGAADARPQEGRWRDRQALRGGHGCGPPPRRGRSCPATRMLHAAARNPAALPCPTLGYPTRPGIHVRTCCPRITSGVTPPGRAGCSTGEPTPRRRHLRPRPPDPTIGQTPDPQAPDAHPHDRLLPAGRAARAPGRAAMLPHHSAL